MYNILRTRTKEGASYKIRTRIIINISSGYLKESVFRFTEKELQAKANECAVDEMVAIFEIQQLGLDWVTNMASEFLAQKEQ